MGGAIWLYKQPFHPRILGFLHLQRQWLHLRWSQKPAHRWHASHASPKRMVASGPSSISNARITPSRGGHSGWSRWSRSSRRFPQGTGYFLWTWKRTRYFHIQIAPHHRWFLRFAFKGVAYQYTVLPFGLSLAPRTFTKCMNAAFSPLRQMGIHIYIYSFSRSFYPKRLTIEEYNKRYII